MKFENPNPINLGPKPEDISKKELMGENEQNLKRLTEERSTLASLIEKAEGGDAEALEIVEGNLISIEKAKQVLADTDKLIQDYQELLK